MIARVLAGLLVAALLVAGGLAAFGWRVFERPGPLRAARAVVIPRGSFDEVLGRLQAAGALPAGEAWRLGGRLAAMLTGGAGAVHAGELAFPAHASLATLLRVLRTAAPVEHRLTLPEGLTAAEIAGLLAQDPALSGPTPVPPEGSVLPETYEFSLGTTRQALLARAERAMTDRLAAIWAGSDPSAGLRDRSELLILASLVERETAQPGERPMVARVFLNRLRDGMRLQSDPTVAFAATGGLGALHRPLSRADLALDNPYNTYTAPGLPPGPICAPGVAALEAVAHPASGPELYFVADGSGRHVFATDLAEHRLHVEALRAREAAGGR